MWVPVLSIGGRGKVELSLLMISWDHRKATSPSILLLLALLLASSLSEGSLQKDPEGIDDGGWIDDVHDPWVEILSPLDGAMAVLPLEITWVVECPGGVLHDPGFLSVDVSIGWQAVASGTSASCGQRQTVVLPEARFQRSPVSHTVRVVLSREGVGEVATASSLFWAEDQAVAGVAELVMQREDMETIKLESASRKWLSGIRVVSACGSCSSPRYESPEEEDDSRDGGGFDWVQRVEESNRYLVEDRLGGTFQHICRPGGAGKEWGVATREGMDKWLLQELAIGMSPHAGRELVLFAACDIVLLMRDLEILFDVWSDEPKACTVLSDGVSWAAFRDVWSLKNLGPISTLKMTFSIESIAAAAGRTGGGCPAEAFAWSPGFSPRAMLQQASCRMDLNSPTCRGAGYRTPRLAIVVPIRNREESLAELVSGVAATFHAGNAYTIWAVEQDDDGAPFNRGALLNAGYVAAESTGAAIIALHDVDYVPLEEALSLYEPPLDDGPRHALGRADSAGGVVVVAPWQYRLANGYPNCFWGWGFEDHDLMERFRAAGLSMDRSHWPDGSFTWFGGFRVLSDCEGSHGNTTGCTEKGQRGRREEAQELNRLSSPSLFAGVYFAAALTLQRDRRIRFLAARVGGSRAVEGEVKRPPRASACGVSTSDFSVLPAGEGCGVGCVRLRVSLGQHAFCEAV